MKVKRGLPKLPSGHYTTSCRHLDSQNMRNVNNHLKISNANSKWSEEKKKRSCKSSENKSWELIGTSHWQSFIAVQSEWL